MILLKTVFYSIHHSINKGIDRLRLLHDALNGISLLRRTRTTVHVTAGFPIKGTQPWFFASRVTTSFQ